MKRVALAMWLCLSIPALLPGQSQSTAAPADAKKQSAPANKDEEDVLAAIRARLDAVSRNDVVAWATYVDDDMVAPLERAVRSKQAWIKQHQSWPREVKYWYGPAEDVKVRLHGDTAVVTYHSKQFSEIGGQTTYQHKWQIETLMRQGKKWVLVGLADGLIPLEPVAAKIDPRVYDDYVGQYEWAPTLISTVTRDGDRLLEQFAGQESELLPENEITFFVKGEAASGDSSRVIFVKDSTGRVTHYVYHELGGTSRIVKKIK